MKLLSDVTRFIPFRRMSQLEISYEDQNGPPVPMEEYFRHDDENYETLDESYGYRDSD